jgi:hypothetical protein
LSTQPEPVVAPPAPQGKGGTRLAAFLREEWGDRVALLDDRIVPRIKGHVDHVAVARSGVWVIDSRRYGEMVEFRENGSWFKMDERLFVDGRDRTALAADLDPLVEALERVLESADLVNVPVHAALCFTNWKADWLTLSFAVKGVLVTWPKELADKVQRAPSAEIDLVRVAQVLDAALHAPQD